jgi:hypothetical protein
MMPAEAGSTPLPALGQRTATSAALFAAAAVSLAYALKVYDGWPRRGAMIALCVAVACSGAGTLLRIPLARRNADDRLTWALAIVGVVFGAYALATTPALQAGGQARVTLWIGIAAVLVLALSSVARTPPLGRLHVPLLLVAYLVVGIAIVRASGTPVIDVFQFHREAFNALLAGHSPYSTTIPNLYDNDAARFYGEGLVIGGRVHVGYPYPPLNLLLALPAHLAGDYRYALVAAVAVAAGFIAYANDDGRARAAAALLLFLPSVLFVCGQGWTEPFVAMTFAAVIFCAARSRRALPFALGAFLASKQYAVLVLPVVMLLFPRRVDPRSNHAGSPAFDLDWKQAVRVCAIAIALAAAVSLPFLLADPRGFVDSVLMFQVRQPVRADSLSVLAKLPGGLTLGSSVGVAAALTGLALSLWRAPRTGAGFAGALALTFLLFFAVAKQAFWNYYFFVFSTIACALGARDARD